MPQASLPVAHPQSQLSRLVLPRRLRRHWDRRLLPLERRWLLHHHPRRRTHRKSLSTTSDKGSICLESSLSPVQAGLLLRG
jgi:hypothetical protein